MAKHQETETLPQPFSPEDFARIEEAQRQLHSAKALIDRCKRCKIPVEAAERDCDDLCNFFAALIAEFRGPQGPINTDPQGRSR